MPQYLSPNESAHVVIFLLVSFLMEPLLHIQKKKYSNIATVNTYMLHKINFMYS